MTTTPPTNARPYRRESEPGTEMRTTTPGRAQRWRQIGWHGQSGAFYALDEKPTLHEPGSIAPLWLLVDNEPADQDDAAEVREKDIAQWGADLEAADAETASLRAELKGAYAAAAHLRKEAAEVRAAAYRLDQIRNAARLHRQQLISISELYAAIDAVDAAMDATRPDHTGA